jgi:[ribosomal protein S18]-alanine N-acetyltransferase
MSRGIQSSIGADGAPYLEFRLRPMEVSDIPVVMAIEVRSFSLPWTEDAFLREIEKIPFSRPVIAEELDGGENRQDKVVVGYACWWEVKDECHITNVTVSPEARRRGVGKFLLTEIIEDARNRGAVRATLEARISNKAALSLYEKFGFNSVAMRPKYYPDNGEDAMVMLKDMSE